MSTGEPTVQAAVQQALTRVFDPCSVAANAPLNVVEMGLITQCELDDDGVVRILVSATSPSCILIGSIMKGVVDEVSAVDGVSEVDAQLDTDTFWTPELMTEEGRAKLDARRQGSLDRVPLRPQQWRERRPVPVRISGRIPAQSVGAEA